MVTDTLLASRYHIQQLLGKGGMGTIWLATDVSEQKQVVVKLIAREIAHFPVVITRFLREMRILAQMQCPNIVRVLDRGVDVDFGPYLVMEKLEGEDLESRIRREGPLSPLELAAVVGQLGAALDHVHSRGLVHRDIKPSNVFLCNDGQVKLLDFGAVKANIPLHGHGGRTSPGMLIGTLTRMSPEQLRADVVDHRTDVWGLACLVYEAFVGQPVFHADVSMGELVMRICETGLPSPSLQRPNIPEGFDAWFARSTQKEPSDRYESVTEQVDALCALCRRWTCETEAPIPDKASPVVLAMAQALRSLPPLVVCARVPPAPRNTWPAPCRLEEGSSGWQLRGSGPERADDALLLTLRPPRKWPSTG
jgi:serine/threonine-protein kinase